VGHRHGAPVLGTALLLVISILPSPTPALGPGTADAAAACSLVPQLRAVTLNEGLGSYATLARGKETLVRLFLSLPSCAGSGASIALTGGTLTVLNGTTTLGTISAPTPVPAAAPNSPLMAPYASAPALDSPADPKFVVPGSVLAPSATTVQFTATFKATVRYSAKTSKSATAVSGTATFTSLTGSTAPITATVQARTNALRILVVPLGNASKSYASQFSAAATTAVQNAMTTMSRTLPVPAGVADLGATSGGIRYTINPTLLDIGAYMTSGMFCGGGDNFDAIKGLLAQYLQSWNTANPAKTADIVLGAVDSAISTGSSAQVPCLEGMASVGSPLAWIRAIPDVTGAPSISGALASHETGHTQGVVPLTRDDPFSLYHSPNIAADGTAPGRGYNVTLRSYLAAPRTVMTLSSGWDNTTTLYEPADYAQLLCALGGLTTPDCPTRESVGTSTGVGAGPRFVLSGTTDGTPGGTDVVESYYSIDVAPTKPDPASAIRLLQLHGTAVLSDLGVPTSDTLAADAVPPPTSDIPTDRLLFSASFAFDTSATTIRLVHRSAPGDVVLYERAKNGNGAPTVSSVAVAAQDFSNSPFADDTHPSLSSDGRWVAWTVACPEAGVACPAGDTYPRRVFIAPVDKLANARAIDVARGDEAVDFFDPVLVGGFPGGELKLAFARSASATDSERTDLYSSVVGVIDDFQGGMIPGVPVSMQHLVWSESEGAIGVSEPTWSPDGSEIAFTATQLLDGGASDIWVAPDVDHATPFPTTAASLTFSGDATSPSWSKTSRVNRIAYVRNNADSETCASPAVSSCIWTVAPNDTESAARSLDDADQPAFGSAGDIYFVPGNTGGIAKAAWNDGPPGPTVQVTTDATDDSPSSAGLVVAWSRQSGFGEVAPRDIWLLGAPFQGAGPQQVAATATLPAGTDPADVRADIVLACGTGGQGTKYLVAVAVPPSTWTGDASAGGTATFDQRFDPTLACAGGTITVLVSDGFLRSASGPSASTTVGSDPKPPVAAIYGPPDGSSRLQWNVITLRGSGKDPEDGELTGASLAWHVTGPDGLDRTATGVAADLPVPSGGWPAGDYIADLTVTDSTSWGEGTARALFTILADTDNDGIPASLDRSACGGGTSLDNDPSNAYGDLDGDGIPNAMDPAPCVPATDYLATVTFDPQSLYLSSNGNTVTMYASIAGKDMRTVTGSSIRIDRVAGEDPANPSEPRCTVDLAATAYTATASRGTVKLDRQKLIGFLTCMGMTHRTVELRIVGGASASGSLPAWTFTGIAYSNVK